jgi:hypothetical protein
VLCRILPDRRVLRLLHSELAYVRALRVHEGASRRTSFGERL